MESSNNTSIKIIVGVVVVALAGVGIWQLNKDTEVSPDNLTASTTEESTATTTQEVPDTSVTESTTLPVSTTPKPTTPAPTPTQPTPPTQLASTYKNGSYTIDGNYRSPEGNETIGVTLTLNNDVVTSASITVKATDGTSKRYQRLFQEGFSSKVVGKNIDSISLGVINGASLTPKGFNEAVDKIQAQAKA